MKTLKKLGIVLLVLVSLVIVLILGGVGYLKFFLPDVGAAPELAIQQTDSQIERGRYLANHVMVCIDCHSQRDWSLFSGPPVKGSEGAGGERFGREFGFPGEFYSPNITPYNLKNWTDGEIFRLITTGVTKNGEAIFSVMPYLSYGTLEQSDIEAVISYIRTLHSLEASWPPRELDFPMNLIINTIPKPASFSQRPDPSDAVNYGHYLLKASACADCHTKMEKGQITGEYLAGGFVFPFPDGSVLRSSNITPDATGIGGYTREFFIRKFKDYTDTAYTLPTVQPGEFQSIMPWYMYSGMTEEDLGAIYEYLQTVPPVKNVVEKLTVSKK